MKVVMRLTWHHSVYRAGAMLRLALLVIFITVNVQRLRSANHPAALSLACAVMFIWSMASWYLNQRPEYRTPLWMGLDLLVTIAVVAPSRWILGSELLSGSYYGVPGYWMVSAPLALAIWRGPAFGSAAGLLVGMVNYAQMPSSDPREWVDLLCMVMVPGFVGFLANHLESLIAERDLSFDTAAKLAERERLNRIVHDGVLQVLALVERDGSEFGPKGERLAKLAGDQEARLRLLLQDIDVAVPDKNDVIDLVQLLSARESATVTVSTMAGALLLPIERAMETDAAVAEVLANTRNHAGENAKSWILLERDGDEVLIAVRDNGKGMSEEEVVLAQTAGHLGISASIMGRIASLGGTAHWSSSPGTGVEWELRIPVEETAP
jgi:signal transduction histidine kinase